MAESSRNAVVDNATKDSYFLMHIAPARRKEREDENRPRGRRKAKRKRDREKEEEEDKETEARERGLNAGRKKQRLGTKVASAGKTSEYGDAGTDIEESHGRYRGREVGGVCKYFSNPHRGLPFPASSFARLSHRFV
ncbi:hypothetical protein ALC57_14833 [Trachymyrmex cornetzi]|uniref:Uncharacterized protein n=1 Tax=Trachymyrmex cornetzi TaxID=471704 RepID=A0A151IXM7_9HYME|nr:hypothetical protein ALC57_14833 [Trachymyrmex cornetzi]